MQRYWYDTIRPVKQKRSLQGFLFSRLRRAVQRMNVAEAEEHLRRGEFLPGSMAPKVEAGIEFLRGGGRRVLIGLPEELPQLLTGEAGTEIII